MFSTASAIPRALRPSTIAAANPYQVISPDAARLTTPLASAKRLASNSGFYRQYSRAHRRSAGPMLARQIGQRQHAIPFFPAPAARSCGKNLFPSKHKPMMCAQSDAGRPRSEPPSRRRVYLHRRWTTGLPGRLRAKVACPPVEYVIGGEMDHRYIVEGRPLSYGAGGLRIDPKRHLRFVFSAIDRREGSRVDDQVRTDAIER